MKNIHSFKSFEIDRNVYIAGDAPKPAPTEAGQKTIESDLKLDSAQRLEIAKKQVEAGKAFLEQVQSGLNFGRFPENYIILVDDKHNVVPRQLGFYTDLLKWTQL